MAGEVEPAQRERKKPKLLRAPRAPTQKEVDEHMATHLLHQPWCYVCIKGRGRNATHKINVGEVQEEMPAVRESEEELSVGPVPRICIDYFYLSNSGPGGRKGGPAMSTKELQRRLR